MKSTTIILLMLFSLMNTTLNAQDNDETYVVRLNHKLLNYRLIDNSSFNKGTISDFLANSKLDGIDLSTIQNDIFNLLELNIVKMFPHLKTKDSLSIGRQGNIVNMPPFWATFKVKKPDHISNDTFFKTLKKCYPIVIFVDPPLTVKFFDLPNDSLFTHQTSLYNFGNPYSDIDIDSAWNIETGKNFIKVGVFDSGIDSLHPDIDVLGGYGYFYDEIDLGGVIGHSWGQDLIGHGTSVAGIIGAKRNNGIGIAGIAGGDGTSDTSGVSILDFGIGLQAGIDGNDISKGIIDAARVPYTYYNWDNPPGSSVTEDSYWKNAPGYGIHIGNHSYGLLVAQSPEGDEKDLPSDSSSWEPPPIPIPECFLCRESFLFSLQNGVTNTIARGNNKDPFNLILPDMVYPQLYDDSWVISVGASGIDGNRFEATVNNGPNDGNWYSPIGLNIDLIAPGSNALVATTASSNIQSFPTYGWYRGFNGTSASTPHVTGVAALLMSYYNKPCYSNINLDPADIEYILQKSATPLGSNVPNDSVGYGRLNAYEALKMIELPKYQIIHPTDPFVQQQVLSVDTITVKLNKPLNSDGHGPIGSSFPLQLERIYNVVRHKFELTYNFSQYIQDSTELLDTWVRHSQTNSLAQIDDTITILEGQPIPAPVFYMDSFQIEPMAQIEVISGDSTITLSGYYYHFIGKQLDDNDLTIGTTPENYWYPINPYTHPPKMAYSIYIKDSQISRYDFPCDAENPLIDTTVSVKEITNSDFLLFPNPASQTLNISFSDNYLGKTISITSIDGKTIESQIVSDNTNLVQFNIGNLSKGLYLVKVTGKNGSFLTKKWIKQ